MKDNRCIMTVIAASVLTAWAVHAEEPQQYNPERYDVILDRSPFGSDPVVVAEETPQQQDAIAAKLAAEATKKMRLCFLLESQDGEVRAGFQNLQPAKGDPKSFILRVNESFMGMKLVDINLEESTAVMDAQGKPVEFKLKKSAAAPAKKAPAAKPQQQPRRQFGGGFRRREPPPEKPKPEPEPQLSPEEQARRRAEIRANLQQYQMEVIRSGMPPLPIPLTQEMDDQLVAEGVLPPAGPGAPGQ